MRRRLLTLALIAVSPLAIACADSMTAPNQKPAPSNARREWECRSGVMTSSGWVCTDSEEVKG